MPGSVTARVWEIADALRRDTGRLPSGREVVDRYVAEGGNEGTGFTQYSHWKRAQAARGESGSAWRLTVDASGRLELPEELRSAMLLDQEGRVTARLQNGELRLITPRMALRRLREIGRRLAPDGEAVVDEFIAEKRRDAELE